MPKTKVPALIIAMKENQETDLATKAQELIDALAKADAEEVALVLREIVQMCQGEGE